jgi:archaellum component FlaC
MRQISERLDYLSQQSAAVSSQQYDRAGNAIEMADSEIARLNDIMRQMDELEDELDRIKHIKEIVRGYRQRVEQLERSLESSGSHRDSHRHHHGDSSRRHRR